VLSGDLSFVGGGTIITIAGGGGAVLATASYGLSGDGGVVFGCVLLVGVCVCLLFWLVEIQRRFGQLKNLLHVGIHESKVLMHFRVLAEHLFFFCSFLVIFFLSWN
jgi:hypothetical protein